MGREVDLEPKYFHDSISTTWIIAADAMVSELVDKELNGWNSPLLEYSIFTPAECKIIKTIPISLTNQRDV
jgi:hypothetical protein